jgi:putative spermidine/putrescine transport system permease protein
MTRQGHLFRTIAVGLLVLWSLAPLVPLVIWSFARGWRFPEVLPTTLTLDAWRFALSDASGVLGSLGLSLAVSAMVTALALMIGLPAGRALRLRQFRGKAIVEAIVLAPLILPGIVIALGLHGVFLRLGLTNSVAGVVLVHLVPTLPYMILVMAGVFARYDPAFEDQARSLGASPRQTLWHVTLPAVLPGILVGSLFTFLISWSQFILTLMIGGGRVTTLPLLLFGFATSGRNDLTGAIAVIYVLPGIIAVLVTARHVSGRPAAIAHAGRA